MGDLHAMWVSSADRLRVAELEETVRLREEDLRELRRRVRRICRMALDDGSERRMRSALVLLRDSAELQLRIYGDEP